MITIGEARRLEAETKDYCEIIGKQHCESVAETMNFNIYRGAKKLLETKRKMLDAMGNSKMANVFEGTEPLKQGGSPSASPAHGPMANRDPNDAGVDISGLFSLAGQKWNALK